MAKPQRVGSLEIGQDLDFQRKEWEVQRVAWLVVLVILLAAVAGIFGAGPLSHAEAASGPLEMNYDRIARRGSETTLTLRVAPQTAVDGELPLWLDRDFLDKVNIDRIVPEPAEMEAEDERVIYRFVAADPEQVAEITFQLNPAEPGIARGRLGVVDGAEVSFAQFIYP
jgi:hypothetical protein